MASPAFATKARVAALQGASHLTDTQTVFTAPSHVHLLDPMMTFEMGAANTDAEGGILRKFDSGNVLYAYLGHQNTTSSFLSADTRTSNSYIEQNNPIEVIYGTGQMAFGLSLSMVDNEQSNTKESTAVLKWGMNMDDNWVYAHLHGLSKAEKAGTGGQDEISVTYLTAGGNFVVSGDDRAYVELDFGDSENDPATGANTDIEDLNLTVGWELRHFKTETADVYYGLEARYAKREVGSNEVSGYSLPAYLGIEYTANDWAKIRASLSQNILLGESKDQVTNGANAKADGIGANTTVSGGLGLKYKNFVLDGVLTAATTGNVNGSTFLSQASLTYYFE